MRFCTVGVGNTAVDFTAFFFLNLAGMPYMLAQVLSYSSGIVNSYYLNRKWTFRVPRKANFTEVAKFITVNGLSLLVASGLLYILHDTNHLNLWLAKIAATGIGTAVNFMGSRIWVFEKHRTIPGDAL
jgi:putative flippase GtrA